MIKRRCKTLLSLVLASLMCSCSSVLDNRQIVGNNNLGVIFFADIVSVYSARTEGTGFPHYQSTAEAISDFELQKRFNYDTPFRDYRIDAVRSAIGALVGDIETKLAKSKCLYIIRSSDKNVTQSVSNEVLTFFGEDKGIDRLIRSGKFLTAEEERNLGPEEEKEYTELLYNADTDDSTRQVINEHLTVAQSCDIRLIPGEKVFLTVSSGGATIHPLDDRLKAVRQEWEKSIFIE